MCGSRELGLTLIPLIDGKRDHPSDPIAGQTATARSEGQGRSLCGRLRLALDRSEDGGRLSALGQGAWCKTSSRSPLRRVMQAIITCTLMMISGAVARAEPASSPPPEKAPANHQLSADPWAAQIAEAAQRFDIPEQWIRSVMGVESDGETRVVSAKGAIGLMQIMPATWEAMRSRYGLGDDPFDPYDNITAGAAYLREMYDRYGAPGFLAAYNAGPARYEEHKLLGVPLPDETRAYLDKLASIIGSPTPSLFAGSETHTNRGPEAPLFAVDARKKSTVGSLPSRPFAGALFVTVKPRVEYVEPNESDSSDVQQK